MQGIHHVSKIRLSKKRHRQNLASEPVGYTCALCGGERYHLVLVAEALNNHVGLIRRCSICNASSKVIEGEESPPRRPISYVR